MGTLVAITGSGFSPGDSVVVDGKPVMLTSLVDTQLSFKFPPNSVGGTIAIRRKGAATDLVVGTFTVEADPIVLGFSPSAGPGGTQVEIRASGLMAGDQVFFNKKILPTLERGPSRVVVTIPKDATTDFFTITRPSTLVTAVAKKQFAVVLPAPVVTGIAPTGGAPGTSVRITGANFAPADRVFYGRIELTPGARTQTTLEVTIPPSATLSEPLFVRSPRGVASSPAFALVVPPLILSFRPEQGAVGTRVEILGAHFLPQDRFFIGDVQLRTTSIEEGRVIAEIPETARTAGIEVQRGADWAMRTKKLFEVLVAPSISGFSPMAGPPGTMVTIAGAQLTPDVRVFFGAQRLNLVNASDRQLQVVVPQNATDQPFVVVTRGGSAQTVQPFQVQLHTILAFISPTRGPVGSQITLAGKNFGPMTRLFLNGIQLPPVAGDADYRRVSIPAGATSGFIELESYGKRETTRFRFDVLEPPVISTFSPMAGPAGSRVTLQGANFTPKTLARFGNVPCRVVSRALPHSLVVEIPLAAGAADHLFVEETGMQGRSAEPFRVLMPPRITSFAPLSGPPGTQVTLSGTEFTTTTLAYFGDHPATILSRLLPAQIVVSVPVGVSGLQHIWVEDQGQRIRSAQTFNIVPAPIITLLTPQSGPPGTVVTLDGQYWAPDARVSFGALPCAVVKRVSTTRIQVQIPTDAVGAELISVESKGVRATSAQPFHVIAVGALSPEPATHHEHAHDHPHNAADHHHHPHAHPHRQGSNHHHPY